jgi:hypothetical protein
MKAPLLIALLFISSYSFSQDKPEAIEQYCLIRVFDRSVFNSKVEVSVDSGQIRKTKVLGPDVMKNRETGKKMIFDSEADALNYFAGNGWQLMNAFPVSEGARDSHTKYLFKKTSIIR